MNIKVTFHKSLLKYTKGIREVTFNVSTYNQLITAIEVSFPALKKIIKEIKNGRNTDNFGLIDLVKERLLTYIDYYKKKITSNTFFLLPLVAGSKNQNFLQIVMGAALIVAGVLLTPTFPTLGPALVGAGIGMVIGGTIGLIMGPPKQEKRKDEEVRENEAFGPLSHTFESGTTIPIVYGRHRVAGQFLSGEIRTLEKSPDKSSADILQALFV